MTTVPTPTNTSDRALREAMAEALYELDPFATPDAPHEPWPWEEIPACAKERNRVRADKLIAGPIAALRAEIERLQAVEVEALLNDRPVFSRRKLIAERDDLASELGRVKADKTALRRCIDHAMAETGFAEDDEKDGSATPTTRRVRFSNIRDCLNGVGDLAAHAALQEPTP